MSKKVENYTTQDIIIDLGIPVILILRTLLDPYIVSFAKSLYLKNDQILWLIVGTVINRVGSRLLLLIMIWMLAYVLEWKEYKGKWRFLNCLKTRHYVLAAVLITLCVTMISIPVGYKAYSTPEHKKMLAGTFCIEAMADIITGDTVQVDVSYEDVHFYTCQVTTIGRRRDYGKSQIDYISFATEDGEYVIPNVMDTSLKATYFLEYYPQWRITIHKHTGLIQSIEPLGEKDGSGRIHVIF